MLTAKLFKRRIPYFQSSPAVPQGNNPVCDCFVPLPYPSGNSLMIRKPERNIVAFLSDVIRRLYDPVNKILYSPGHAKRSRLLQYRRSA